MSTVLGLAIALGVRQSDDADVAAPVFGANATFVALILPAAALANVFLEARMLDYLSRLLKSGATPDRVAADRSIVVHFDEVRMAVTPLLKGFVLLLVGLALSTGGLFHSTSHLWSGGPAWLHLRIQDLLDGGALGFDVVAVLMLFPFAWLLLDTRLATQASEFMHAYLDGVAAPSPAPGAKDAAVSGETGVPGPAEVRDGSVQTGLTR